MKETIYSGSLRITGKFTQKVDKVRGVRASPNPKKNRPDKKLPGPVNNNHIMAKTKSVYIVIQVCIVFPDDRLVILVEGEGEL